MTTLADIETMVARDLRDASHAAFSVAELDDLINQGIDALADFYPKEMVSSIAIASGTSSYALPAGMKRPYRIDAYDASGNYLGEFDQGTGDGANSGWELHASVLWLPPRWSYSDGSLRVFGYGIWAALTSSAAATDLDASGLWAVRIFCQVEGFQRLLMDRAKYQQWQESSNASDISPRWLTQMAYQAKRRWSDEQRRLRTLRKV